MSRQIVFFTASVLLSAFLGATGETILETPSLSSGDAMLPQGHRMALHLDCSDSERTVTAGELSMTCLNGAGYDFPGVSGALGSVLYDPERVTFLLDGLRPDRDYVLGFTWWDADNSGRVQSVQFAAGASGPWQTVLPPVRVAAFHADKPTWARVLLPLAAPYSQGGTLRVAFVQEAGPNAVVNELWLLEREASETVKRVLIVTGDDYAGHDWRATAPALALALRQVKGLEVSITECPAIYGSSLLSHYDATVVHFKNYDDRLPLGPECREGIRAHVASGKGLALCHFGCGAFQDWDGFVKLAGRIYNPDLRPHDPYGAFTVSMTQESHPVTSGMIPFEVTDELYTCLDGNAPIRVLCEAQSVVDQRGYPMAFVTEVPGGRVFHCLLGHDARVYEASGPRALYQRGIAWASGLVE
ncbi:MAG: Trehalose utilization [Candidatus Hydrogenedentes bacterium ADurb.Bin101]|nr:MAG: Trehalose utilization [Candidatus Hydrogenedentes bacterium ADurb.Bin101]